MKGTDERTPKEVHVANTFPIGTNEQKKKQEGDYAEASSGYYRVKQLEGSRDILVSQRAIAEEE